MNAVAYPGGVRFLRRNDTAQTTPANSATDSSEAVGQSAQEGENGHTPKKGHPTPKRRDAQGKRKGPVPPPPKNQREAIKRARGSKQERKQATAERRERMMQGDDRYLMPRDKGPVRAYVRDIVDTRRHLMGLFMPLVLVVFATTLMQNIVVQQYATLLCLILLMSMVVEGTMLGRQVNKRVRAKHPDSKDRPFALGWYAFTRAMQIRKLRVPRPRLTPKDAHQLT